MKKSTKSARKVTVGLDLGKKYSHYFSLSASGEVLGEGRLTSTAVGFCKYFKKLEPAVVVIEAGSISHWTKSVLEKHGHEVLVANPRQVALIYANKKKNDRLDAQNLARLGRLDPELLAPVQLRGAEGQADIAQIRTRDLLVGIRTAVVNHVRSGCTGVGEPLPSCSTKCFHRVVPKAIPRSLKPALDPVLELLDVVTAQIDKFDKAVEKLCEKYPETENLKQIPGVGSLTALTFVLTLHDKNRFEKSRQVGAFLGLVPRLDHSCAHAPQLRITKAGDSHLRRLLVTASHYILGHHGDDCDLRRFGQKICPDSRNKSAKKRAVIAVSRKLSVLLHHLWVTGETYDPHYNQKRKRAS